MKDNKASQTAQYMALFRALETTRPVKQRLFVDPFAISFLDRTLKTATRLSPLPFVRQYLEKTIQKRIPGAFSSGIARTRYIDDLLLQTVEQGIRQVIILGAGFDTRALRLAALQSIPVIEIDHPNTSRKKLQALTKHLRRLPDHVRYWQLDFNADSLDALALREQLNFQLPTTIIWEGVSNYLTAPAVQNTFQFASRFTGGSYMIFTYVHQQVLTEPEAFFGATQLLKDLANIEEKWTFGFEPSALSGYLRNFQFTLLEDSGALEYRNRYMPDRTEQGYEFYRVAFAKKL